MKKMPRPRIGYNEFFGPEGPEKVWREDIVQYLKKGWGRLRRELR